MVLGQEDMREGSRETASPGKGQFCPMEGGPHGGWAGLWTLEELTWGGILGSLEVGQCWRPHEAPCTDLPQRWCRDAGVSSRSCVAVCAQGRLREKQHFPSGFRGLCLEHMAQPTGFSARWVRHLNASAREAPRRCPGFSCTGCSSPDPVVLLCTCEPPRPSCSTHRRPVTAMQGWHWPLLPGLMRPSAARRSGSPRPAAASVPRAAPSVLLRALQRAHPPERLPGFSMFSKKTQTTLLGF